MDSRGRCANADCIQRNSPAYYGCRYWESLFVGRPIEIDRELDSSAKPQVDGCKLNKANAIVTRSLGGAAHELSGDQPWQKVRIIRRAVAAKGHRRNERLPVQGREAAGRLHLARSQEYR